MISPNITNNTGWYIVKFEEENTVEAVPVNWFKDICHCHWSPYNDTTVSEAIRLNEAPSKSWKLFNCTILSKTKIVDYTTAMKKACRAQYESEISESESVIDKQLKRIKKRNPKYDDEMKNALGTKKKTKSIPLPPKFGNIYHINIPIITIYFLC